MSDPPDSDPKPAAPEPLQFDRVESLRPPAPLACAACKAPLPALYYLAGTKKVCPACRDAVQTELRSGSPGGRALKAAGFGFLAAVAGGILWAVLIATTEHVFGLVAIGIGILVGIAVRKGSDGRGGRGYQVLALALCYFGMATGYGGAVIPLAIKNARTQRGTPPAPAAAAPSPSSGAAAPAAPARPPAPLPPERALTACLMGLLVLAGLGLASPVLVALESPMTWLFLGIAMWEAWKLNRAVALTLSGPFRLGAGASSEAGAGG